MNVPHLSKPLPLLLAAVFLLFLPEASGGQTVGNLESGKVMEGSTGWEGGVAYAFEASEAGVLTVVVRAAEGNDVYLLVSDADGQPLPNGRSDQDLAGDAGAEQFAVNVPRAGSYRVGVEAYDGTDITFKIGVSWLPFPDLAVPADPDGTPGSAKAISIGQDTWTDALDGPSGDFWDWYVLKADKAGTLTVATRADDGDLILEAFSAGEFVEALERSDQDLQGNGGNEAITLVVEVGDEFYFKVSAFSEGASIPYRLQVGFIPTQG
jgi:hypothetical protein